jgi:hypothetical protein
VGKKMYYIVVYIQRRAAVDQSVYMCGRVACGRTTHTATGRPSTQPAPAEFVNGGDDGHTAKINSSSSERERHTQSIITYTFDFVSFYFYRGSGRCVYMSFSFYNWLNRSIEL